MARDQRRRAERLLVELLRPGGPRQLRGDATDLMNAALLAAGHGLFLLADQGVREWLDRRPGSEVRETYERGARPLRLRLVATGIVQERAQERVAGVLGEAGIVCATLKGPGLNRRLYGEGYAKSSADVDLLVRSVDVERADAALVAAGFARDDEEPFAFQRRRRHHALYRGPGGGIPVELHWGLSIPGFFDLDEETLWGGIAVVGLHGRLDATTTLVQLLMHHHLHGCADLRTLVDLAWGVFRLATPAQGEEVRARLQGIGLDVVAAVARRQAGRLWGPLEWPFGNGGSRGRVRALLVARAMSPPLRRNPDRDPMGRVAGPLALRLALDTPRRVLWSFAKTVFPGARDRKALARAPGESAPGTLRYWRWRLGRRQPRGAGGRRRG